MSRSASRPPSPTRPSARKRSASAGIDSAPRSPLATGMEAGGPRIPAASAAAFQARSASISARSSAMNPARSAPPSSGPGAPSAPVAPPTRARSTSPPRRRSRSPSRSRIRSVRSSARPWASWRVPRSAARLCVASISRRRASAASARARSAVVRAAPSSDSSCETRHSKKTIFSSALRRMPSGSTASPMPCVCAPSAIHPPSPPSALPPREDPALIPGSCTDTAAYGAGILMANV